MREITLQELLEAGCHFGHQVNRRNPKADEYIFEARSNVHIINLEKTHEGLMEAAEYVKKLARRGGSIIFVGNKRQAQTLIREAAGRAKEAGAPNLYFVASRWIGGTFTNFSEVSKNFKKLNDIRELLKSRDRAGYTKREMVMFGKEEVKLDSLYGGIADLKGIPDAIFVVDSHLEQTAIDEASDMKVSIVGITDTNADPSLVQYAIPANDDAVGSIKIITDYLTDAWIEGSQERVSDVAAESKKAEAARAAEEKKAAAESAKKAVDEKTPKTENKKEEKKTSKATK